MPAATTPAITPALGVDEHEVPWVLLGTLKSGRVLRVGSPVYLDACHSLRAELLGVDESRARLRVVEYLSRPLPDDGACETRDIDRAMAAHDVRLPFRLEGRAVAGPRKQTLERNRTRNVGAGGAISYDLRGLRVSDAVSNLRAFGIHSDDITVRGSRDGYVVALRPELPATIRHTRAVTVVAARR